MNDSSSSTGGHGAGLADVGICRGPTESRHSAKRPDRSQAVGTSRSCLQTASHATTEKERHAPSPGTRLTLAARALCRAIAPVAPAPRSRHAPHGGAPLCRRPEVRGRRILLTADQAPRTTGEPGKPVSGRYERDRPRPRSNRKESGQSGRTLKSEKSTPNPSRV